MTILAIVIFLIVSFLGYLAGRCGDYYLNFWIHDPSWAPHHWIYGYLLVLISLLFLKNSLELWVLSFGLGLFISDLKDFFDFKLIGSDKKNKGQRKFWNID